MTTPQAFVTEVEPKRFKNKALLLSHMFSCVVCAITA